MKLISHLTQQSRYYDVFGLTDGEIDTITIGTPTLIRLPAAPGGARPSPARLSHDAPPTADAVGMAHRTLD
ncbi:hypothetical protein WM11_11695 [Burkholderia ubonensis]|uniref:hypothetical protein n=1 Tax=Burkholderia ubonensis TaxID=101571 RepID=UPI00075C7A82|nr:hypothetical protein [Burkholderia ubonensis]KWK06049.1 hypothetical protein WM11_11695 [Burkholderia ubonensis]KWK56543.1 hypothetical protein WM14_27190 [Burkholderia ubonensis]